MKTGLAHQVRAENLHQVGSESGKQSLLLSVNSSIHDHITETFADSSALHSTRSTRVSLARSTRSLTLPSRKAAEGTYLSQLRSAKI